MARGARRSAQRTSVAHGGSLRRYNIREARIQTFTRLAHPCREQDQPPYARQRMSQCALARTVKASKRTSAHEAGVGLAGSHAALPSHRGCDTLLASADDW